MSEITEKTEYEQRIRNSLSDLEIRHIFGTAVSHDPVELHSKIPFRYDTNLRGIVMDYLQPTLKYPSKHQFLAEGISDMQTITRAALDDAEDIEKKVALRIFNNPVTILAITEIALCSQAFLKKVSHEKSGRKDYFRIVKDRECMTVGESWPDESESRVGCPYAGKGASSYDEMKTDPLFNRFASWAGTLAVLRYYDMIPYNQLDRIYR